ncbi:hypothetical protein TWF281_001632 [Arthrobotrys megalospora]
MALIPSTLAAPYQQAAVTKGTKCTYATNTPAESFRASTIELQPILSTRALPQISPISAIREPAAAAPTPTPLIWWEPTGPNDIENLEVSRLGNSFLIETTRAPPRAHVTVTRITEITPPEPTTVTIIPVPPPPPPPKTLHCIQRWYGTAPFCNGKCPSNWNVVRYQREAAKTCDSSTPDKIIDQCENTSKHGCSAGYNKVLCEQCELNSSVPILTTPTSFLGVPSLTHRNMSRV